MHSLTITISASTGPYDITIILEMTDLADCGRSLYIEFVHLVGALFDYYHWHPCRAVCFNDHPRTKEDIHKS